MESAHDSFIWDLSWHPLGHILVSCSSDQTSKFWCRNRPGEEMKDKYNTASALITEDSVEGQSSNQPRGLFLHSLFCTLESYMFPSVGGPLGGGAPHQRDAITLPPPAWSSHYRAVKVGEDPSSLKQTAGQDKDKAPLNVPVLGADIIAEQFGDKPKLPTAAVAHGDLTTPTANSPFNLHMQRPFDDQGRPPAPDFRHPEPGRGGILPPGPPHPLPGPFRHPPPDQLEWRPPPRRDFIRPVFGGPPPPGEFNRPSPYSWQRSAANLRERRPSYEDHRMPPQEMANPYVYRRPEVEPQRDPRRPDWREGPPQPRQQPPWEQDHAPPHSRPAPPMREEFPDRPGPGGPAR